MPTDVERMTNDYCQIELSIVLELGGRWLIASPFQAILIVCVEVI